VPNDIDLLKQEFLAYLSVLIFPSPEILVEKTPSALQETKLNDITLEINSGKNLSIKNKNDAKENILLNKDDLGRYGLSIEDFRKGIESIKNKNPEITLLTAIEETLILNTKRLCEIYIPQAILAYTTLYKKFKLENPKVGNRIYNLIDEKIEDLLANKETERLTYNYFKRACQGYASPQSFAYLAGLETENLKAIFNITKKLHINFTRYQTQYDILADLIEELYIHAGNKTAIESLIDNLKLHIDICFSNLIQTPPDKKTAFAKNTIENFISTTQELIKNYIENHPNEYKKQRSILDRLLWFITKLIPSSILSEDKRMTLFGNYTESGRQIKKIDSQIKAIVQQQFVY
jgi:hypothetical protein